MHSAFGVPSGRQGEEVTSHQMEAVKRLTANLITDNEKRSPHSILKTRTDLTQNEGNIFFSQKAYICFC